MREKKVNIQAAFNGSSKRFSKFDVGTGGAGPEYHVAGDAVGPTNRWDTKGWTASDDPIKQRGTSTGKRYSSMAAPTTGSAGSTWQPMFSTHPNETRLQELLDLQRRKTQSIPAPGTYEVQAVPSHVSFRRPADPALDGPFPADAAPGAAAVTTRLRELAASLRSPADSGIGPGQYEGVESAKDKFSVRSSPSHGIGTGARDGVTPHTKTLSISRSLQHGIDWHVPVIVQARPAVTPSGTHQPAPLSFPGKPQSAVETENSPKQEKQLSPSRLPASGSPHPPSKVTRVVQSHAQLPSKLDHNYRTSWTTQHGGSYCNGNRPPPGWTSPVVSDSLAGFGPRSSVNLANLPLDSSAIFPIEESTTTYRDISGSPELAPSPQPHNGTGENGSASDGSNLSGRDAHMDAPGCGAWGSGTSSPEAGVKTEALGYRQGLSNSPASPATRSSALITPKDARLHQQALQAASRVREVGLRRELWLERSGAKP